MSASTMHEGDRPGGRGAGSVVLIILGSLASLLALALLAGGIALVWAHTERDDDGYFTARAERITTPEHALTVEGFDLTDVPDWALDRLGTVRLRATGADGESLFLGLGTRDEVDRYLDGVGHAEVVDLEGHDPVTAELETVAGGAPETAPGDEDFWELTADGTGTQTLTWDVEEGDWSLVVMNVDGSGEIEADVEVGAKVGWLLALGLGLIGAAVVFGAVSALLLVLGIRRSPAGQPGAAALAGPPPPVAAPGEGGAAAQPYPVALEARLDEPLSRGLWLVKWLLALPHWIVLAFLWLAFIVLSVVAFFAILFTGRYPRSVFDFNLGVLRWTWRVTYYAVSGIGTDRYPPFSLGPEPDYPATLDVEYPERLSHGLVLVKWLLAIPHLIIVAVLTGNATWAWTDTGYVEWPGLIGLLTFVAGVILLFRGRYNRDLFELIVGFSRWVYRVLAYVGLMRDEYPPFRLGR